MASLGLFSSAVGALGLYIVMHHWEEQCQNSHRSLPLVDVPSVEEGEKVFVLLEETKNRCDELEALVIEGHEKISFFEAELNDKAETILGLKQTKEDLLEKLEHQLKEFSLYKSDAEEQFMQNQLFLNAHQNTIQEQRDSIEAKQQQIAQLEGKVRDLTYEIKTLLQLAEKAESIAEQKWQPCHVATAAYDPSSTPFTEEGSGHNQAEPEGIVQLRACIETAQNITGSGHYGQRLAKVRDLSIDSYTLDLRHLSEHFNSHQSSAILFYSAKENKPLFINESIKGLLEWTAEKYIQNFSYIIQDSEEKWKGFLAQLSYKNEIQGQLLMKNRSGKVIPLQCCLGVIPSGVFRGNFIAIFYD